MTTGAPAPWPTEEDSGRNIGPEKPGANTRPSPFAPEGQEPQPVSTTKESPFVDPGTADSDSAEPKTKGRRKKVESEVDPEKVDAEVDPDAAIDPD